MNLNDLVSLEFILHYFASPPPPQTKKRKSCTVNPTCGGYND